MEGAFSRPFHGQNHICCISGEKQLLKAKSETGSLDRWMGTPCTALSTRAPVILIKIINIIRIDNVVAQLVAQFLY